MQQDEQGASQRPLMTGVHPSRNFAAVVVAAGKGERAGQPVPKQFALWRGKPLVRHCVEHLFSAGAGPVTVAIPPNSDRQAAEALAGLDVNFVSGGRTRQQSVRAALESLAEASAPPSHVLIHDAARPDLPRAVIDRLLSALDNYPGAVPVLPVVDSLVRASGMVMEAKEERESLHRAQTPQAFRFSDILAAHRAWQSDKAAGDDAQVLHAAEGNVALVEGDIRLAKITFAEDFMAERPIVRTGLGFDVHRLAEGEELWLGGIKIPHHLGLTGHSDADVVLHALVDAILGALGNGDIGTHFPPENPQWKGASSALFLQHAATLLAESGYSLAHADITIICESPRIGPHRDAMRAKIAELLGVDSASISVKATTTEQLGFTGRQEGIAAQAVATLQNVRGN